MLGEITPSKRKRIDIKTKLNEMDSIRQIKNEIALRLLSEWMEKDSGYDEQHWKKIKKMIEANKLSNRKRFDD